MQSHAEHYDSRTTTRKKGVTGGRWRVKHIYALREQVTNKTPENGRHHLSAGGGGGGRRREIDRSCYTERSLCHFMGSP